MVYFIGDVVRVIDDVSKLHELQMAGPGWVNDLAMVSLIILISAAQVEFTPT